MFARYYVELALPSAEVEGALVRDPLGWLGDLAEQANHKGDLMLADVGLGGPIHLTRKVLIDLGPPVRAASKTVLPLRWTAADHPGAFPALEADLEVASLGPRHTQLAMSARYSPPLGMVGRMLDRAFLSRIAEVTLKDFLDRVAEAIANSISAPDAAPDEAALAAAFES